MSNLQEVEVVQLYGYGYGYGLLIVINHDMVNIHNKDINIYKCIA